MCEQPSAEANDGLIGELQKSWWVEDVRVALTVADDVFSSMSAPAFLERPGTRTGKMAEHFGHRPAWLTQL